MEGWAGWMAATHAFRLSGSARGTSVRAQLSGPVKKGFLLELQKILGSRKPYKRFSLGERITLEGVNSVILLSSVESPPPGPPGCPATGTQAHDRSRELSFEDRLLSALPQSPTSQSSRFADNCKWSLPLPQK